MWGSHVSLWDEFITELNGQAQGKKKTNSLIISKGTGFNFIS